MSLSEADSLCHNFGFPSPKKQPKKQSIALQPQRTCHHFGLSLLLDAS
jgi:hypothetical protein